MEVVDIRNLKFRGQHDRAGSIPAPSTRSPYGDLFFSSSLARFITFIYFCVNIKKQQHYGDFNYCY